MHNTLLTYTKALDNNYYRLYLIYDYLLSDESLDLDSLLAKLHGRVDTQWFALGTALGIPTEFLDSLKSYNYPDQDCMVEMLDYWLRNHPDQPTWKEIADAIEDIHDYLLAKSIKAVYDVPSNISITIKLTIIISCHIACILNPCSIINGSWRS